ncbi:MAG: hypothetical protein A3B91_00795 [Candidatus Yanofskybacteria bacterium RIFCSPHIGHO2_02_FULL_41_29]|uniref:EfeO-type cupredoxin-like domain-containing protein n=1 Tax=Candidatus Yanofskybacteria bacterium RIFCSPHIGHO2_01_FULL_41_53 TaxID=1802663 RepID=A0A1F8EJU1_9BACT|nr:MAG: hypothetical protein A2650_00365 [Candidatus Yanofskybacteria bacterium RIFCSPHIGHO2_01_FULL_41_53]OGN12280.1 MAG: hypothetical protein A3B91_00795 [Candidatus Yanofskybacteria bacterium RIFCSPHIGHO2_02_FULL_41_29]OGN17017.1 MAG: hypothetical protein A3F48_03665 [Candidatus Yanofskybacteria bacterium RIFCSPHIGHO2_12_FULL_41_9]OGN23621.1 MAG: hypothetical protein A2916_01520 [Candidatus Yanofskybacteria bacterium RIFCSPLOWO2_01_FULL_41_67]OGN29392.1 MAG: hypothetical protein A3H54_04005 
MNFWIRDSLSKRGHNPAVFWILIVVLMLLSAGAVQILGSKENLSSNILTPTPEATKQPRLYTVSYKGGVFSPTNLRIHAGDTVRFKNESFFGIRIVSDPHPTHNQIPGLDSVGDVPQGSYFSYTFSEKGIFGYHNENRPEEAGTIIVR